MVAAKNVTMTIESFFATCPEMVFIARADGSLLQWSASLRAALGPVVKRTKALAALVHPDDGGAILGALAALAGGTSSVEIGCRLPDATRGGYRRFSCVLTWASDGELLHGSLREPSQETLTTEELDRLRHKERILQALIDNVDICVWAIEPQGNFIYHDGKGLDSAGVPRRGFVGKNIFEIYHDQEDGMRDMRQAFSGTPAHYFSNTYGVDWENWVIPVQDGSGELASVIGFTLDISKLKRAERELRMKLVQIEQQQRVIRDLSTPIIEVWDGVLTLPMVGVMDSVRVADVMGSLLTRIVDKSARFAILDLTGVEIVDTKVASHLINMVNAIQLLGAEGIITGIRPTVAQTMVALGLDMTGIVTHANLRAALAFCIRRMSGARRPEASASA